MTHQDRHISVLTLLLALLTACGSGERGRDCRVSGGPSVELEQDVHGFVEAEKCDSLFLSGLVSSAGYDVDIEAAEGEPGEWFRRPTSYPECWASGESRSTISRDQLLGLYWHIWTHGDLAMAERLWDYGMERGWKMGDGRHHGADTLMNPAMLSTLAQMIYRLGGEDNSARHVPTIWHVTTEEGQFYRNRLTAVHLTLREELYESIGLQARTVVNRLVELWPDNPLYRLAAGDTCTALDRVLDSATPSGVHSEEEYVYEKAFVLGRLRHGSTR